MKHVIIDETTGNPFPHQISIYTGMDALIQGASHVSPEGFYHNDKAIADVTGQLARQLGLRSGQKTLDVGYDKNLVVSQTFAQMGMLAYGLDSQDGLNKEKYSDPCIVMPYFTSDENGMKKYCGTVEDLHEEGSELRDELFDLIIFWGSWDAAGYNFAVGGEMGWFRAVKELELKYGKDFNPHKNTEVEEALEANRRKTFENCRKSLRKGGGILIVSSRYAFHGGGYITDQLADEKQSYLKTARYAADMGASELWFFGLSKKATDDALRSYPEFDQVRRKLIDDDVLFENVDAVHQYRGVPIGRIDGVYSHF
ncbi:MAG: hypothetical protein HY514_00095 [Candidatus Aenigmarchaeota archaeon]|nr:hypothetical protein [Candidatus Aenigmarchaeota archaeon]